MWFSQPPRIRGHSKWPIFRGGLLPASVNQKKRKSPWPSPNQVWIWASHCRTYAPLPPPLHAPRQPGSAHPQRDLASPRRIWLCPRRICFVNAGDGRIHCVLARDASRTPDPPGSAATNGEGGGGRGRPPRARRVAAAAVPVEREEGAKGGATLQTEGRAQEPRRLRHDYCCSCSPWLLLEHTGRGGRHCLHLLLLTRGRRLLLAGGHGLLLAGGCGLLLAGGTASCSSGRGLLLAGEWEREEWVRERGRWGGVSWLAKSRAALRGSAVREELSGWARVLSGAYILWPSFGPRLTSARLWEY
jgi:hypothetical protein